MSCAASLRTWYCVFRCSFAVLEGYGQTECTAAATITSPSDCATLGHVGGPVPCNEIKLVSVPEMDYNVTDTVHGEQRAADGTIITPGLPCFGRGEVCYRGPNIFKGYGGGGLVCC